MWTVDYYPLSGSIGASAAIVIIPILALFVLLFMTRVIIAGLVALAGCLIVATGELRHACQGKQKRHVWSVEAYREGVWRRHASVDGLKRSSRASAVVQLSTRNPASFLGFTHFGRANAAYPASSLVSPVSCARLLWAGAARGPRFSGCRHQLRSPSSPSSVSSLCSLVQDACWNGIPRRLQRGAVWRM